MTKPTMRLLSALLALPLLALGARAAHAVPNTVSFTARITDNTGAPVTGPLTLKVAVFDAATAGTMVWEETHTDVPVANGLVYTSLGSVDAVNNGLDGAVLDGRALFAELTVDGDVLSPRIPIESVPYAVRAAVADTLQGFDPTTVQQRVTGTCATGNYITAVGADGSVTCAPDATNTGDITGVTGTGGITGGGTSGAVSLSIDTSVIQARVTGTCATGNYITAIAANGSVTCAPDASNAGDITSVTAGTGLNGGGTTGAISLAVDTNAIQTRIATNCGAGTFMTGVTVNGTPICATDTIGTGDITDVIAGTGLTGGATAGAATLGIANLGVTSAMLAAGAVTAGKIAADAVGANEIAAGAVGTSELGTNAVTTAKILDGSVTMAKTSAPIGMSGVNLIAASSNASQTFFPTTTMTPDAAGSCFVTAWAQSDSNSNRPFYMEPALLNTATNGVVLPPVDSLVPTDSPSGVSFGYTATSSAVFPVAANVTYRPGCYLETSSGALAAAACRVTWVCN